MISDCRFPFYTPNPRAFLNSREGQTRKTGKNTSPIWTEFYGSLCDCSSSMVSYHIVSSLISKFPVVKSALGNFIGAFVQQNFLKQHAYILWVSIFYVTSFQIFKLQCHGCHVIALKSAKCWCIVWNFLLQENQWDLLVHLTTDNTKYPGNPVRYHVKLQSQTLLVEICPNR